VCFRRFAVGLLNTKPERTKVGRSGLSRLAERLPEFARRLTRPLSGDLSIRALRVANSLRSCGLDDEGWLPLNRRGVRQAAPQELIDIVDGEPRQLDPTIDCCFPASAFLRDMLARLRAELRGGQARP
jgi:hypothetical protein